MEETAAELFRLGQAAADAYGAYKTGKVVLDETTKRFKKMAEMRERIQHALQTPRKRKQPRRPQGPNLGDAMAAGFLRTGGYYGRYNKTGGRANEVKFFDTTLSFSNTLVGTVVTSLNLIPQGTEQSERIGRTAVIHSIMIKGIFTNDPGASNANNQILYMTIVQDTQCNGANAGVTDVLTSTNLSTAMINLSNSKRFRILKKFSINLNARAGVDGAYCVTSGETTWFKKCNIPIEFSSVLGAITEIASNNVFLVQGATITGQGAFNGTCRIRFSD